MTRGEVNGIEGMKEGGYRFPVDFYRFRFRERAQYYSRVFRDQFTDPLEEAVFWVQYQLRWAKSTHLQTAARNLNFFQYHSLDVIAALLFAFGISCFLLNLIVKSVVKKLILVLKLNPSSQLQSASKEKISLVKKLI
jgi:hypothetical protein